MSGRGMPGFRSSKNPFMAHSAERPLKYSETFRLLEEGAAAFSEDLLCSETLTLLRQRGRVALLILAGGGMLLLAGMGAAGLAARKGPGKNGR